MNKKVAIFTFNGDIMIFAHALLNALDMKGKGYDVKLIIEGASTIQVKELLDQSNPFANLYDRVKKAELIDCVCQACSNATGSFDSAKKQGLPICGEMSGHPSISKYMEEGYAIIVL